MSSMIEAITLGIIQGVTEWIPISSEGLVIFAKLRFFPGGESIDELVSLSLFLHLGTFFAALVYFWSDVKRITGDVIRYPKTDPSRQSQVKFLGFATLISGVLGFVVLQSFLQVAEKFVLAGKTLTAVIAIFLLVTGIVQVVSKKIKGFRSAGEADNVDAVLLGVAQGLAVLPGISRSGITVSALLLRRFDDNEALRLSFLLSMPIVLAGNIVLNVGSFSLTANTIVSFLFSFVAGYFSVDFLMRLASRINFGYFAIFFGSLMFASAFMF
ncbi:MAG: undecaprenyl-diphosphate phosphatase [Patescibacteria group bacterium]